MKCSVIVTAYNQGTTIGQTLDSILAQKCDFPFEIIIGDDCSTDGTKDICEKYRSKYPDIVHPLYHKQNGGVAINFVYSIAQAKGKYIAICAADDFWHNADKLQLEVDFLEKNSDYGMVYTDYDKLNAVNGKIIKNWLLTSKATTYEGGGLITQFFLGRVPALTLTVVFRHDLYEKYIPADDYIKYKFPIEDWQTWLILSKYSHVGYLPISTATYRYGQVSLSNPNNYEKIEEKYAREKFMYKYLCDLFPEDLLYDEKGYDNYVIHLLLSMAYKKKDFKSAKKYAKQLSAKGINAIKTRCATNAILFYLFYYVRLMKNWLK